MTTPPRLVLPLAAVTVALPLAAGCGTDAAAGPPEQPRPATVEQIAAKLGCTPQERGKLKDYRQASCRAKTGNYQINTFNTAEGQREWLDHATLYGGVYLVGTRWIVAADSPQSLAPLREQLGGRIEDARRKQNR
jgi:hypothetical protein